MTQDAEDHLSAEAHAVNEALREYGATYAHVARAFAAREGLHSTDATAMIEILTAEEQGTPLSPARLSERIGLSFGATSTLLNRLEGLGHISRSRVHTDRRIVTLQSTPGVQEVAESFFHPLGERLGAVMADRSPAFLAEFAALLQELRSTMIDYVSAEPETDPDPRRDS